jgi:hypothetical protein
MELLATVHWVSRHEGAASADEAVERTYAWSERTRMFTAEQIRMAWKASSENGWLEARAS